MDSTYIKVFRNILNWEWYTDANTFRVFMHILLKANYKPSRYKGVEIPTGACVFGFGKCAEELGLSVQNVKTAINHLKSTHEITTKSTNRFTVVKVEKWGLWQGSEGEANRPTNRQANKQLTNNQPATNFQLTTSKESKKVRRKEGKNIYKGLPAELVTALEEFEHMRTLIKAPLTEEAKKRLLTKLTKLAGEDTELKIKILHQSIDHDWKGVYELKDEYRQADSRSDAGRETPEGWETIFG